MTNEQAAARQALPTLEYISSRLEYNAETGVFVWKARGNPNWDGRYAGTVAGRCNSDDYVNICLDKRMYKAHRIAWLFVHGYWPSKQIDHINGVRSDNRIANLREVSNAENARNQRRRSDNKSGVTGVVWVPRLRKWAAQIATSRSCTNLGFYADFEDAVRARKDAEAARGFHENHGRHP